jgi:hypothetical protein
MHRLHFHEGFKTNEPQRNDHNRVLSVIQNPEDDVETIEYGYRQALFDLLKEPVCLGIRGASGHRGRQR